MTSTTPAETPPPAAPKPTSGVSCPGCGACPLRAVYTRYRPGAIVRVRECRQCRRRIRTVERAESLRA